MKDNNLKYLSTRQPTYWPRDPNKIPDHVNFCVTKGTGTKKFTNTSDHTPIPIIIFTHIPGKSKKPSLYSKKTDWNCFRETMT
jgi:hypothetical protein